MNFELHMPMMFMVSFDWLRHPDMTTGAVSATVFHYTVGEGKPPDVQAMANYFNVSVEEATQWVSTARNCGFLQEIDGRWEVMTNGQD